MMRHPKICILTAVYNGSDYIEALIQSVLAQNYENFEHIIIDDGSTDDGATVAVLSQYSHLKWWSRGNKGQYATQNEALTAADGDIVCIISADDIFAPDTFKRIVEVWHANPDCDVIYGHTEYMDANSQRLPIREINGHFPKKLIRSYLYVQHCSLFVSRRHIEEHGIKFNASLRHVGDWDWIIQLFEAANHIQYLPRTLSVIRMHPEQITRTSPLEQIRCEHRYVLETYGGHYIVYRFLKAFLTWRSRIFYGLYYWRNDGPAVFVDKIFDWLHRHLRIKPVGE